MDRPVIDFNEIRKRNRIAAKKASKDFLENMDYYLDLKSKESEPCDLNGRDLYHGASRE